jgi:hypothetical protein
VPARYDRHSLLSFSRPGVEEGVLSVLVTELRVLEVRGRGAMSVVVAEEEDAPL